MREAGSVEWVIGDPKHPYSQLLVSSIPLPDLSKPWGGEDTFKAEPAGIMPDAGCKFASRCPHVMPKCRNLMPLKFLPDGERLSACFLYDKSPVSTDEDLWRYFGRRRTREEETSQVRPSFRRSVIVPINMLRPPAGTGDLLCCSANG